MTLLLRKEMFITTGGKTTNSTLHTEQQPSASWGQKGRCSQAAETALHYAAEICVKVLPMDSKLYKRDWES